MIEVQVPRQNVNDESVIVAAIHLPSGSAVKAGEVVLEIETSKSNVDVHSPGDGFIYHELERGMEVPVSAILFRVKEKMSDEVARPAERQESTPSEARISNSARKRASELGVDLAVFKTGLITARDVENVAQSRGANPPKASRPDEDRASIPSKSGNRLVLFGGGVHAKMCIDILRQRREYEIVGIVDTHKPAGLEVLGVKILGGDALLEELWNDGVMCAINAVGSDRNPGLRQTLFQKLKKIGFFIPNLVHPSAVIEPSVRLGEGNQIMMGACIGSDSAIGDNCIVNSGAIVSHDAVIGSHTHIAPGAVLGGVVTVGEAAVIGMAATIYMHTKIGAGAVINNGADVFRDVAPNEVVKRTV